ASVVNGPRPPRTGSGYSSAKTYAATTRASRSVISSSHLEGTQVWKPFFDNDNEDPRPASAPFHIKPLVGRSPLPRQLRQRAKRHVDLLRIGGTFVLGAPQLVQLGEHQREQ